MQCHLEPTSSPLPFRIRRYEQPPFSYSRLESRSSDYFIYFDHAPGSGSRRQVRDRQRRVPPAQVGMLSAQRDDVPHVPRPARHPARARGGRASGGGVPGLPPGECITGGAPRVAGVAAGRDLHRLPHAEAAHRRCRSRGDDRPLHPAPAGPRAICWPPAAEADTSRAAATIAAKSSCTIRRRCRQRRRTSCISPWRRCSRGRTSRPASADSNRRSRSTGPNARRSTTSSRAHTRRREP